jgi:hypothetical protein
LRKGHTDGVVEAVFFDTKSHPAYIGTMEKPKRSMYDIGVYLFLVLVVVGLFVALWRATDFFTAVAALQFFGPILVLLSIGPSMLFGKMVVILVRRCEEWFKSKKPPDSSASGHPVHTTI